MAIAANAQSLEELNPITSLLDLYARSAEARLSCRVYSNSNQDALGRIGTTEETTIPPTGRRSGPTGKPGERLRRWRVVELINGRQMWCRSPNTCSTTFQTWQIIDDAQKVMMEAAKIGDATVEIPCPRRAVKRTRGCGHATSATGRLQSLRASYFTLVEDH